MNEAEIKELIQRMDEAIETGIRIRLGPDTNYCYLLYLENVIEGSRLRLLENPQSYTDTIVWCVLTEMRKSFINTFDGENPYIPDIEALYAVLPTFHHKRQKKRKPQ